MYGGIAGAAEAVYYQILQAVQAAIKGLDLTGIDDDNVKLLKTPQAIARNLSATQLPCIVVCPWDQVSFGEGTNIRDDPVYPVLVALINAENANQTENFARTLKWAEGVRRTFNLPTNPSVAPWPDIEEVFSSEVDPRPIYNLGDWSNNLGVTGFVVRVFAREVRTV